MLPPWPWIREPHQHCLWQYDPTGGFLYQYKEEDTQVWKRYCPDSCRYTRRIFFEADGITAHNHLPPGTEMAGVLPKAR
jgi:hypothetical protein